MKLFKLLDKIEYQCAQPLEDVEIGDVIYDSRKAFEGCLFVCIKGALSDGHQYAGSAYEKGARIFAVEGDIDLPADAKKLVVADTRVFLALASANYFEHPAEKLLTVAITGTKGKTTTSFMIKSILTAKGLNTGIIGTLGVFYNDVVLKVYNSTPESYLIHKYMRQMVDNGCKAVVMEASSQGFMQKRTYGIEYDAGVFTNLSPDHIGPNEHKDMEEYLFYKKTIFKQSKFVAVFCEDEHFNAIIDGVKTPYEVFGMNENAGYYCGKEKYYCEQGKLVTEFECIHGDEKEKIHLSIPGKFNIYNALAATAVARHFDIDYETIRIGLFGVTVKARMEVVDNDHGYTVIIDYAHNEISTQALFEAMMLYSPSRIITLFGCGGGKAHVRRFSMGEIVGKYSALSVITSDNPRYDNIDDINADILVGMNKSNGKYIIIKDRKSAIEYTLSIAQKDDLVLLIGKGHEPYEEINGVKHPFDERAVVDDYFRNNPVGN